MGDNSTWRFIPNILPNVIWSGHVLEICEDHLVLELRDISDATKVEIMEFPISMVPESEKELVSVGKCLYLAAGTHFEFTKFPEFTKKDIKEAEDRANNLLDNLDWE